MQKSTSRSCHTRSCLSFISQILTAQCTFATLTSTLFLSSTTGGASVIFLKQNLFADSRSYSMATPSQPRLGGDSDT